MRPIPFPVFLRLAADSERTGSARRWAPALQFSPRTPYSCWEGKPRSTVYFPCKHFRVRDCPARPDALNFRVLTASGDYSAASPPQPPPRRFHGRVRHTGFLEFRGGLAETASVPALGKCVQDVFLFPAAVQQWRGRRTLGNRGPQPLRRRRETAASSRTRALLAPTRAEAVGQYE